MNECKQACRWCAPAKLFDGPVMRKVCDVQTAIKKAFKGSPERTRLENLLTSQACLCWSCGKRCSKGEAAELSHAAGNASRSS